MAYTEAALLAKITALEGQMSGIRSTTFSDRSVTYSTSQEIQEQISYFTTLLNQVRGAARKQAFGVASKGF